MNKGPLEGLRVLEFTHAVMGPCAGLMLADNGAEVIHIERPEGDSTRFLKGFGTGYFWMYNRNKKSLAIDLKSDEGKQIIFELAKEADIVVENFGPGTMDRLGYGYEAFKSVNPRIIYCALKGFLSGPYEKRHAMDEVVQMMGGLSYMTGRTGDPLRAGTSVVDIAGGMFGYIGILQALYERERTGEGKYIKAALYEACTFMMGQHMAYQSQVDYPIPPMPERVSAWSIYKVFETKESDKVFIGIISEKHWKRFCEGFEWDDWLADERLATNNGRIDEREWFLPALDERVKKYSKSEIISICEKQHIPFAPIAQPGDLYEDVQLNKGGSLIKTTMGNGEKVKLPKFPIEYGDYRSSLRHEPPNIGQDNESILSDLGMSMEKIEALKSENVIS